MNILIDPRIKVLKVFFTRWRMEVKGQKLTKLDPANTILAPHAQSVHSLWTKFGIDIQLDPKNEF